MEDDVEACGTEFFCEASPDAIGGAGYQRPGCFMFGCIGLCVQIALQRASVKEVQMYEGCELVCLVCCPDGSDDFGSRHEAVWYHCDRKHGPLRERAQLKVSSPKLMLYV